MLSSLASCDVQALWDAGTWTAKENMGGWLNENSYVSGTGVWAFLDDDDDVVQVTCILISSQFFFKSECEACEVTMLSPMKNFWTSWLDVNEIQQWGHAIEGDLSSTFFKPIFQKWK